MTLTGAEFHCQVDPEGLEPVLRALTAAGVRALTSRPPTLEELFLRYYADGSTGSTGPAREDDLEVATR